MTQAGQPIHPARSVSWKSDADDASLNRHKSASLDGSARRGSLDGCSPKAERDTTGLRALAASVDAAARRVEAAEAEAARCERGCRRPRACVCMWPNPRTHAHTHRVRRAPGDLAAEQRAAQARGELEQAEAELGRKARRRRRPPSGVARWLTRTHARTPKLLQVRGRSPSARARSGCNTACAYSMMTPKPPNRVRHGR